MGIQINGQTDTISSTDGSLNIGGTVTVNVTGDATGLTGTPDITVGVVTASSAIISGDLTVNGTTTTLDTTLTEVDKLEVGANNTTVGVAITQSGSGDILRLYDGATQAVTVTDGGSVGIGTDNPTQKLEVYNSSATPVINIRGPASGSSALEFYASTTKNGALLVNSSGFLIAADNSNPINFNAGGSERLRITSSGNIGINTSNPQRFLHIVGNDGATGGTSGNSDTQLFLDNKGVNGTIIEMMSENNSDSWIMFSDPDAPNQGRINYDHATDALKLYTTGTPRLTVDSNGGVVIGGTSKASRLTVVGPSASQAGVNGGTVTDALAMFYGGKRTTIATNNHIDTAIVHIKGQITDNDTNSTGTHSTGQIVFSGRRATGAQSIIESATTWNRNNQTAGSQLRFYTAPVSNNGQTAAQERLRIESGGTLFSKSPSDATPNFKFISDDTNWHGYLNQTVHGGTISSILSCGGTWTVDGTTYNATKDFNGSFGTAALIVHNQYNSTATGGELVFVTKANGSTNTDGAVNERFRITSSGALNVASPSSTVAAGLLNVPNGSRVTTSSGTYVTGNGGIVDMARYEMIDKCITSFPANNNKICAINGAPLVINDTRDSWSFYSNLPNYLLGTLTHDCINNTSFSFTLACTMTVFLGRNSGWNNVNLTGWNLIESNTNVSPFGSSTRLYVKTLAAGTHTLDNDSAMYFFSI